MPRTYSYDHYKVPQADPNSGLEESTSKSKRSRARPRSGPGEIHYGQSHAETVARAKAHRNEAVAQSAQPEVPPASAAASVKGPPNDPVPRSARPASDDLRGLWAEVEGSVELMGSAFRDLRQGTVRLLRVPLDAIRIARQHRPGYGVWSRA